MTRRVTHLLFDANLTGGQVFGLRLGEALRAHGWASSYVLPDEGPLIPLLETSGFPYRIVSMTGNPLRTANRLRHALRASPPDLIHSHLVLPTQFAARLAARAMKLPIVVHYHTAPTLPRARVRGATYRLIDVLGANRFSARNVAVSGALARSLSTLGVRRVSLVANGVPIPERVRPRPSAPMVLVLGRIAEAKGHDVAVRALGQLPIPRPRMRIVGDALSAEDHDFLRRLRALIAELGLIDLVEMRPSTSDPAVHFEDATCLVVPSRSGEGMPLVVLEAMAVGIPVIAANLAGIPEVIQQGKSGLLFEPEDAAQLAGAIQQLADDEQLTSVLSVNGRRRVEQAFSMARVATDVTAIYQAALENARPGGEPCASAPATPD